VNHSNNIHPDKGSSPDLEIRHSTFIRTDPLSIYIALTTSRSLDSWFTDGSKVNAFPGGEIYLRWVNWGPDHVTAEDGGPVLEAIPQKRFVFQWHPDKLNNPTTVEINNEPTVGGTIVSLREHGYSYTESSRTTMINCAVGWGEALTLLKFYLELGVHY